MSRNVLVLCIGLFTLIGWNANPAQAACEKSHVFLLLDVSGSMRGTKHTTVRTAIKSLMSNFGSKMRFGLATFGERYRLRVAISDSAAGTIRSSVDSYASNENYTRMGEAIWHAGNYLAGLKSAEPPATKKRPYYLILITDGHPTSDSRNPATETRNIWTSRGIKTYAIGIQFNASILNAVASAGQTRTAYNASNQTSLNNVFNLIANTATKEVCDNLDNDCDGATDEGLRRSCSSPCGPGQETCKAGRWVNCTAAVSRPEKCNGKDDDCDGRIDENFSNKGRTCVKGKGACRTTGVYRCKADQSGTYCDARTIPPKPEKCNGIDDNCDGRIDEPWGNKGQTCSSGSGTCQQKGKFVCKPDGSGVQCSAPGGTPKPEVCDGLDNNCNGTVDEQLRRPCKTACGSGLETCKSGKWQGCTARPATIETCDSLDNDCDGQTDENLQRECSSKCGKGKETCVNGRWSFCTAPKIKEEICDGKDNDCDGKVDELPVKKCSGACGQGVAICQNGTWSGCDGPAPKPEVCDGKDNDCDGEIDENITQPCQTACGSGKQVCVNGQFGPCDAPLVQPEVCDGRDNNCDGSTDENARCPADSVCKDGSCVPKCTSGECKAGLKCSGDGYCLGDPCKNIKCGKGKTCLGGYCVDPCTLVKCPGNTLCSNGKCVPNDCYIKGCPSGESCIAGQCKPGPCTNKQCATNEFCRDGKCISSCANVTCQENEICKDGQCKANPKTSGPCSGVKCSNGQYCEKGKCIADPCHGILCAKGRVCKEGKCEGDPCINIQCPNNQTCVEGQCTKKKPTDPGSGDKENTTNPSEQTTTPDGGVGPSPDQDGNQDTPGADETKGGSKKPTVRGGSRYNANGCGCSTSGNKLPVGLWLSLFVLGGFVIRRKHTNID